jgi:hypothetical protein
MSTNRLFTFGCSFTEYVWPTWANILGREFDFFENWGRCGGGNLFIFNSLIECITQNNVTKDDTVVVMWTDLARNDLYSDGQWQLNGNLFANPNLDKTLNLFTATKLPDFKGLLIRDLAFVEAARLILNSIGCQFKFFSMTPFNNINLFESSLEEIPKDVLSLYHQAINCIISNVFEDVYNKQWFSVPSVPYEYANTYDYKLALTHLKNYYNNVIGSSWPAWEDFVENGTLHVNPHIVKEFQNFKIIDQLTTINRMKYENEKHFKKVCKQFKTNQPMDFHPLPLIHLNYIEKYFDISKETQQWAKNIQTQILNDKIVEFDRHLPQRL